MRRAEFLREVKSRLNEIDGNDRLDAVVGGTKDG